MGPRVKLVFALLIACSGVKAVSFVYRSGNQLYDENGPFYHMGFNAYWMPAMAAYGPSFASQVDTVLDGAQRLGLRSVRMWAFNDAFPSRPGVYDATQGKGLDYVIAGAGRRGMRVILAIGNFWPAYVGPEKWLTWAEGSASGKNVADFYKSAATLALYRAHIQNITSRVNTITGVAYKNDPTIMGYDLLNEPRCPGCTAADMSARNSFLTGLTSALKSSAPNQLTFSSTEGYFSPGDSNVRYNPGAGSQCDGEEWSSEISIFDVATTHMYYRQLETLRKFGWQKASFDFYVQYLAKKIQLYADIAAGAGRPLVIEEFGLTHRFFGDEERKVVLAVVADALIAAKRSGKNLMAGLFWTAAYPGQPDVGGYNIYINKAPSGARVGLGNGAPAQSKLGLPSSSTTKSSTLNGTENGAAGSSSSSRVVSSSSGDNGSSSGSGSGSSGSGTSTGSGKSGTGSGSGGSGSGTSTGTGSGTGSGSGSGKSGSSGGDGGSSSGSNGGSKRSSSGNGNSGGGSTSSTSGTSSGNGDGSSSGGSSSSRKSLTDGASTTTSGNTNDNSKGSTTSDGSNGDGSGSSSRRRRSSSSEGAPDRRLQQVIVYSGEDTLDSFRRGWERGSCAGAAASSWDIADIPTTVDVARYRAMVAGHDIVDIIAEATRLLNN